MKCNKCGYENTGSGKFCISCGAMLDNVQPITMASAMSSVPSITQPELPKLASEVSKENNNQSITMSSAMNGVPPIAQPIMTQPNQNMTMSSAMNGVPPIAQPIMTQPNQNMTMSGAMNGVPPITQPIMAQPNQNMTMSGAMNGVPPIAQPIQPVNSNVGGVVPMQQVPLNSTNSNINGDKKLDSKKIVIIAGVALLIIIGVIIIAANSSSHKNTTGLKDYKSSDVDLNCVMNENNSYYNSVFYADVLFNYKNYAAYVYYKVDITYSNLTDDDYEDLVSSLDYDCDDCTSNNLNLGDTYLGDDTKVTRKGNNIYVTAYTSSGSGITATSEEMEEFKESLEDTGFTCE